jgi:phage gpG-like protein
MAKLGGPATVFSLNVDDFEAREAIDTIIRTMSRKDRGFLLDGFKRVGVIYLAYTRERFLRLSKSQGKDEWPPLADYTKLKRLKRVNKSRLRRILNTMGVQLRKAGQADSESSRLQRLIADDSRFPILRDTGYLFNSLSVGGPGNVLSVSDEAMEVGTAVEYAIVHQRGRGRVPQREIFVDPDPKTDERMANELANAIMRAVESSGAASRGRRRAGV